MFQSERNAASVARKAQREKFARGGLGVCFEPKNGIGRFTGGDGTGRGNEAAHSTMKKGRTV